MKAAYVFSGQGAQKTGMGKDLAECSSAAAAVFKQADEVLGWSISDVCFNGPDEKLTQSRYCQTAVFTTSMACLAAFEERFPQMQPAGTAGLSLGEYGALCRGKYFDFADALRLVDKRAALMDEACNAAPGTMASILTDGSVTAETFHQICSQCGIWVANFNSPMQTVISGGTDGVARAIEIFKTTAGVRRVVPLKVAGAFHSAMMKKAGEGLRNVLADVPVRQNTVPVAQNITGTITADYTQIKENLVRQVAGSVQWVGCVKALSDLGADTFIEFGPGTVLTGLIRKIDGTKKLFNVSSAADLDKFIME